MPKKVKLNLDDLKVQSFITSLTDEEKNKFKGGGSDNSDCATCTACGSCDTSCPTCLPSLCSGGATCC